jgi:hypothetical protein
VPEGDGEPDVGGRETVRHVGRRSAAEVDHRGDQQHEIHQRHGGEQEQPEPGAPEQVAGDQAGGQHDPEGDFSGDDEAYQHVVFLAHLS